MGEYVKRLPVIALLAVSGGSEAGDWPSLAADGQPVGPDQPAHRTMRQDQVDFVERRDRTIAVTDSAQFDDWLYSKET